MNNIITVAELKLIKDIGNKIDEPKINTVVEQAQLTELKATLGTVFYFDVLANLGNEDYQDLLSGSTFTYKGVNYYQDGLKALLADYFMSKYALMININFDPFGATVKLSQNNTSEPADRNSLKDISTQQMQLAGARWEVIKMYLDANTTLFPKWNNNTCDPASPSERVFRFRKI
jgi:hypothetical protein